MAATDTYGLYSVSMGNSAISRSGTPGSYTYATIENGNFPVNYVTWGDAARFCNWLTNGQPTGAEGNGTTETGSYTLNGATSNTALDAVTRNANASYVIPTQNEWYKAAYYNPSNESYYLYATQSSNQPSNALSATGTNNANCYDGGYTDATNILTAVGAFADSPGPYGTYDQNGDVFQWNESVYPPSEPIDFPGGRGARGGSASSTIVELQSSYQEADAATTQNGGYGFRVAQVPEPTSAGLLGLAVVGMLSRRSNRCAVGRMDRER